MQFAADCPRPWERASTFREGKNSSLPSRCCRSRSLYNRSKQVSTPDVGLLAARQTLLAVIHRPCRAKSAGWIMHEGPSACGLRQSTRRAPYSAERVLMASFPGQAGGAPPILYLPLTLSVTGVSASAVNLSWTVPVGGAASYALYRQNPDGTITTVAQGLNGTTYNDTGLPPLTTESYQVRGMDVAGLASIAYSNIVTATTNPPLPAAPTLSSTGVTANSVSLAWGAVANASTYNLYRNAVRVQSGLTGTSFTDSGVAAGTAYAYTLTAVDVSGEGPQSNTVNVTTSASSSAGILWAPGLWPRGTGGASADQGPTKNQNTFNFVSGNDPNKLAQGFVFTCWWSQLEGAQGVYTGADTIVDQWCGMLTAKGYSKFIVALDTTGNVQNSTNAPAYLKGDTTYGPINLSSGTGGNGGVYQTTSSGTVTINKVRIQNTNVAARLVQLLLQQVQVVGVVTMQLHVTLVREPQAHGR